LTFPILLGGGEYAYAVAGGEMAAALAAAGATLPAATASIGVVDGTPRNALFNRPTGVGE
jgi:hypothetical protein